MIDFEICKVSNKIYNLLPSIKEAGEKTPRFEMQRLATKLMEEYPKQVSDEEKLKIFNTLGIWL